MSSHYGWLHPPPPLPTLRAAPHGFCSCASCRTSLLRSYHSLNVVGSRAYIFGGRTSDAILAGTEIHSLALPTQDTAESDYHMIPAIPAVEGGSTPSARMGHASCVSNGRVAIFGGSGSSDDLIRDATIWLFDPQTAVWHALTSDASAASPIARRKAKLFAHGNDFVLYGGKNAEGAEMTDVWLFKHATKTWSRLPDAPTFTSNAAFGGDTLYLICGTDNLSSSLHCLNIAASPSKTGEAGLSWDITVFPTNPLVPGPRPRENGGLLHISTGFGRHYLVYFFGERSTPVPGDKEASQPTQWSDMWSLQLPSSDVQVRATTSVSEAVQPAKIKDTIRSTLGAESGTHVWAEVEVKPPGDVPGHGGKLHPGPRCFFGCDSLKDGSSGIVLWGGVDAKGQTEGDGWIVSLQ